MRIELALELKKLIKQTQQPKILELGVGEGHLTKYILDYNPKIFIEVLDISQEMINSAQTYLSKYSKNLKFITQDILKYLNTNKPKYDFIISSWTIHNFSQYNKKLTFKAIFDSLEKEGKMILMDKIYPNNEDYKKKLRELKIKRYNYLEEDLKKEIKAHEKQDFAEEYRMDEYKTIHLLKEIGFKNVKVLDRIERDVLLVAEK